MPQIHFVVEIKDDSEQLIERFGLLKKQLENDRLQIWENTFFYS